MEARRPGGPERLRPVTRPRAEPAPGEVAVAVEASGVNYADCVARMGLYRSAWELNGWPLVPGFEIAGRIRAIGPGVERFEVGDQVLAVARFGGYSEDLVIPEPQVFRRPDILPAVEAAALPVSFLTALYAMQLASPPSGSRVLVHSAAGGAGLAITQVAASSGLEVVGIVGSAAKEQAAREAGAGAVIVRRNGWHRHARAIAPGGFAAVFDASGDTLRHSARLVAPMGRLVAYGSHGILSRRGRLLDLPLTMLRYLRMPRFGPLQLANANLSVMAFNLSYLFAECDQLRQLMSRLLEGLEAGTLRPPPIQTFPLREAASAHRALQSGRTIGKLVLTVPPRP